MTIPDKPPSRCACGYIEPEQRELPRFGCSEEVGLPNGVELRAHADIGAPRSATLDDLLALIPRLSVEQQLEIAHVQSPILCEIIGKSIEAKNVADTERDAANALVAEIRTAYEKADLGRMTEMRRAAGLERELAEMTKRAKEDAEHSRLALDCVQEVDRQNRKLRAELATVTAERDDLQTKCTEAFNDAVLQEQKRVALQVERDSMRAQRDCAAELFEASCGDYNKTLLERDAMRPVIEAARAYHAKWSQPEPLREGDANTVRMKLFAALDAAPVSAPEVKPECGSGYCDRCGNMKTECRCAPFVPDAPKPPRSNKAKEDPAATFARAAELQREACADRVKLHYGPCPASDEVTLCELVAYLPQEPAACPKCDEREHYNSLDGCYCCDLVPREELDRVRAELEKLRAENGPSRVAERQRDACAEFYLESWKNSLTGGHFGAATIRRAPLVTDAATPVEGKVDADGWSKRDARSWLGDYGMWPHAESQSPLAREIASWPGFEDYEKVAGLCAKCGHERLESALAAEKRKEEPAEAWDRFMGRLRHVGPDRSVPVATLLAPGAAEMTGMKTREELFDRCAEMFDDDDGSLDEEEREEQLRSAMRAIAKFERNVQARAIQWAATQVHLYGDGSPESALRTLADRIARGIVEMPEPSK